MGLCSLPVMFGSQIILSLNLPNARISGRFRPISQSEKFVTIIPGCLGYRLGCIALLCLRQWGLSSRLTCLEFSAPQYCETGHVLHASGPLATIHLKKMRTA